VVLRENSVRSILMNVKVTLVKMVAHVQMELARFPVNVPSVIRDMTVLTTSMIVKMLSAEMVESVLTK